jgi:hypothetical protein
MEPTMKKILSISSICERGRDGNYTYDALLYQEILRCSTMHNDKYPEFKTFTVWELTGYLIDHFLPLINEFKELSKRNKSRHNKIASKLERIETKIDNFAKLGLVEQLEPSRASRGSTITNRYQYTESGCLIAWVLESVKSRKKLLAEEQIYNMLDVGAEDNPSSYDLFTSRLYAKYRNRGVFGEFVIDVLRARLEAPKVKIMNMKDLFLNLGILHVTNKERADLYSELWTETMNELDEETKKYVLQHIKLEIEQEMEQQVKYTRGFEELRFQHRDQPNILALEGVCQSCGRPSPIPIEIMEYLENTKSLPNDPMLLRCRMCKKDAFITVPPL